MKKKALIFGVTGQDGSYLAELLLDKGYDVHGVKRKSSLINTQRIDHIYQDINESNRDFTLHYGDLTDGSNIIRLIQEVQPDEIYNLSAQSHVAVSFQLPEHTADINALGTLRILEAIRFLGMRDKVRFYQASTSELFGMVQEVPQSENTPFYPRSPYAVAKLYAHWITINYREAYNLFACNGILFNHESPRRGETFVTRKITRALADISEGLESCLYIGNLDAKRDWGHAKDYVEMQWLMLQQEIAEDFVIATGYQSSVRDFINLAASSIGIKLDFFGSGQDEVAKVREFTHYNEGHIKIGDIIVRIDSRYFRPTEVDSLIGDSKKAHKKLGWMPKTNLEELCAEMMKSDLETSRKNSLLKKHGYSVDVANS